MLALVARAKGDKGGKRMSVHQRCSPSDVRERSRFVCLGEGSLQTCSADLRTAGIEMLARLAAVIAGKNPDERTTIRFGNVVAFDDLAWRYPDFLARAEAAYRLLEADELPV